MDPGEHFPFSFSLEKKNQKYVCAYTQVLSLIIWRKTLLLGQLAVSILLLPLSFQKAIKRHKMISQPLNSLIIMLGKNLKLKISDF